MQIAPVNYLNRPARLDFLVVTRVQPAGKVDRLRVSPDLEVEVDRHGGASTRFQLDASQAEDLFHALGALADRPAPTSSGTESSGSPVRFDIMLGWRGNTIRFHGVETAEDDAIRGIIGFAHEAFARAEEPLSMRRQPPTAG